MAMDKTTRTVLLVVAGVALLGCCCLTGLLTLGAAGAGGTALGGGRAGGGGDAALVGTWMSGSVSGPALYDSITGDFARYAGGSGVLMEFKADGTASRTSMLETSLYSCTNRVGTVREGRWSTSGGALQLDYSSGEGASYSSCGDPKSKSMKPRLGTETYRYSIEARDGARFLQLDVAGSHESLRLVQ